MDVGVAALGDELLRLLVGLVPDRAVQHDLGAVAFRGFDLRRRRVGRHADDGVDAVDPRGQRHALRVVAGGRADHAPPLLVVGEERELVERPADLVGARALEQLGLEPHVEAGGLAQHARGQQRRVVDVRADAGARLFERTRRGQGHQGHRLRMIAPGPVPDSPRRARRLARSNRVRTHRSTCVTTSEKTSALSPRTLARLPSRSSRRTPGRQRRPSDRRRQGQPTCPTWSALFPGSPAAVGRLPALRYEPPAFRGVVLFLRRALGLLLDLAAAGRLVLLAVDRRAPRKRSPIVFFFGLSARPRRDLSPVTAFGSNSLPMQLDLGHVGGVAAADSRGAAAACSRPAAPRTAARSTSNSFCTTSRSAMSRATMRRAVTPCVLPSGAFRLRLAIGDDAFDERPQLLRARHGRLACRSCSMRAEAWLRSIAMRCSVDPAKFSMCNSMTHGES